MKKRTFLRRLLTALVLTSALSGDMLAQTRLPASAAATFQVLQYAPQKEFVIKCPVGLICSLSFAPGELLNDALTGTFLVSSWTPHSSYEGSAARDRVNSMQLVLTMRPGPDAEETNLIVTTTRQKYFLHLIPIDKNLAIAKKTARYYSFAYVAGTYRSTGATALATQTAIKAQNAINAGAGTAPVPAPGATPADASDLTTVCHDFDYAYAIDRALPEDHPHGAKPSADPYPGEWKPQTACNDGQHTFIQFAASTQAPVDLPQIFALTAEGDTLINSVYNAARSRYVVNGVYDAIVLELGSQMRPLRMRIVHKNPFGAVPEQRGRHATPIPIVPPARVATADPSPRPPSTSSPVASVIRATTTAESQLPHRAGPADIAVTLAPKPLPSPQASLLALPPPVTPTPTPERHSSSDVGAPTASPKAIVKAAPVVSNTSGASRSNAVRRSNAVQREMRPAAHWEFGGQHLTWPAHITRTRRLALKKSSPSRHATPTGKQ